MAMPYIAKSPQKKASQESAGEETPKPNQSQDESKVSNPHNGTQINSAGHKLKHFTDSVHLKGQEDLSDTEDLIPAAMMQPPQAELVIKEGAFGNSRHSDWPMISFWM